MKTFDELFNEARKISDKRDKVFNELIKETKLKLLPKFCEVCKSYDLKKVYFSTSEKVYHLSDKQFGQYEYFYALCIDIQKEQINDAKFSDIERRYHVPEYWVPEDISETKLLRTGIIEFIEALKGRLEKYNEKYNALNNTAEILLNK